MGLDKSIILEWVKNNIFENELYTYKTQIFKFTE